MTSSPEGPGPIARLAMGALLAGFGVLLFLLGAGVIPSAPGAIKVAPWVLSTCGVVVIGAGALLAITATPGAKDGVLPDSAPFVVRLAQTLMVLLIFGGMAAMSAWIGFGTGKREFTSGFATFDDASGNVGDDITGRILFGASAIVSGIVFIFVARQGWRDLVARRRE